MKKEALKDIEEGMVVEVFTQFADFVGTVRKITDHYIELVIELPINNKVKEVIGRIDLVAIDAILIHSGAVVKE
ncbi:hypothetical protein STIV2_C73 [Sulfolobus turreted icosahedral virus 2]|uniref:Uncharacterized protein n=1 Tax=Sulfolobus turreted icosahedral virus 2 TaxID=754004 RepID=D5IEZ6_9VIRU|nr:hypothetical protein STIV2_C73 [Sulfolobus turreted icosahedral virus 2]ADF27767.1 hypothetical protein STIV2_C73 [Sulfolobus turreted icosahedral virus 2]